MKIHSKTTSGNVLLGTLFVTGIICLYMGSYLTLVRGENRTTRRSMAWNMAIPVAEAGIEEAMTQLQYTFPEVNDEANWSFANGRAYLMKERVLSPDEKYRVGILPPSVANGSSTPTIVSEGFVRPSGSTKFISRTIRVETKLDGYFMPGLVVVSNATLSGGSKLTLDSYNSTNKTFSTNGKYDPSKRNDKAYLATLSSAANALNLGNATIWGKVATAPSGGEPNIKPQSSIGNNEWHNRGEKGIQPGAYTDDVNVSIEPIILPFTSGLLPPSKGKGVYELGSGDYVADNLSGTVLVTGKARLLVTKSFNIDSLVISNANGTASLELYVAAEDVDLTGKDTLNVQGRPSNFKYLGLPENKEKNWTGNKTLKAGGNGELSAMIYAPDTDLTLVGGGNSVQDFSGAALVRNATMKGHYSFHYDESCAQEMTKGFVAVSWNEQAATWDQILQKKLKARDLF